jgi:ubiquitin C-terminal hydrolase
VIPASSDGVLYQIQVLFANLQESLKKYYDTMPFCVTIKDSEGRPINVGQQMDCNEFSNMLFDKLESSLKGRNFPEFSLFSRGTPQEKLLQRIFGGTYSNQLICKECPHKSETNEPFYTLSIEVSRQKNIHDSLSLFTQGNSPIHIYSQQNRRNACRRQ